MANASGYGMTIHQRNGTAPMTLANGMTEVILSETIQLMTAIIGRKKNDIRTKKTRGLLDKRRRRTDPLQPLRAGANQQDPAAEQSSIRDTADRRADALLPEMRRKDGLTTLYIGR